MVNGSMQLQKVCRSEILKASTSIPGLRSQSSEIKQVVDNSTDFTKAPTLVQLLLLYGVHGQILQLVATTIAANTLASSGMFSWQKHSTTVVACD